MIGPSNTKALVLQAFQTHLEEFDIANIKHPNLDIDSLSLFRLQECFLIEWALFITYLL